MAQKETVKLCKSRWVLPNKYYIFLYFPALWYIPLLWHSTSLNWLQVMETGIFQQVVNLETLTANGLSAVRSTGLYGFWYHPCCHFHGKWKLVIIYNYNFSLEGPVLRFRANYMGRMTVHQSEVEGYGHEKKTQDWKLRWGKGITRKRKLIEECNKN